ncbi:MAG: hypothetical protein ABIA63_12425, partial [bacterium]
EYFGNYEGNPIFIRISKIDRQMMEFECKLFPSDLIYEKIVSISPINKVYLSLNLPMENKSESHVVVISHNGGVIHGDYVLYRKLYMGSNKYQFVKKWRLNPFLFFSTLFNDSSLPRMDIAVKNGRRLFYSHIDGDGLISISAVDRKSYCGAVVLKELLKKYPLPFSASFITSEINSRYLGDKNTRELAYEIALQPNVEIASHTFSHPFTWSWAQKIKFGEEYEDYENYTISVNNYSFDVEKEITGSINELNELIGPTGKKCRTLFWSGNCLPEHDAMEIIAKNGYAGLNGGEPRWDGKFNSISSLSPFSRPVGRYRQIYTSNCNETIYTNVWSENYHGFEKVIETFENTANEKIYRPINVYFHYYCADRIAGLNSLKKVFNYVINQKISPVFASEFSGMASDFFKYRSERTAPLTWSFQDYGRCRTVRMDNTIYKPDLIKSENIIGYKTIKACLYIFLGEKDKSLIQLIPCDKTQNIPYLDNTNTDIQKWYAGRKTITFDFISWLPPEIVISGLPRSRNFKALVKSESDVNINSFASDETGTAEMIMRNYKPGAVHHVKILL